MSGHRELTPAGATIRPGKACADEPFPVVGRDVRSGSGDRRASSSRGRDNDALVTDLHTHHRTRDAAGLYNHLSRNPCSRLAAVKGDRMGFIIHPPLHMGGRGMVEELFFHRVFVEPCDGAQPPGNRRAGPTPGFEFPGEAFDIGAADREQRQGAARHQGELAQVQRVGFPGQASSNRPAIPTRSGPFFGRPRLPISEPEPPVLRATLVACKGAASQSGGSMLSAPPDLAVAGDRLFLARPGRVVHVEVEPAVKPGGVSARRFARRR